MKKIIWILLLVIPILGCEDETCVSCIVQAKKDKTIIESRAACDKSDSFLAGFENGIKSRYEDQKDSVDIICN